MSPKEVVKYLSMEILVWMPDQLPQGIMDFSNNAEDKVLSGGLLPGSFGLIYLSVALVYAAVSEVTPT